jgi:hypothetical protein
MDTNNNIIIVARSSSDANKLISCDSDGKMLFPDRRIEIPAYGNLFLYEVEYVKQRDHFGFFSGKRVMYDYIENVNEILDSDVVVDMGIRSEWYLSRGILFIVYSDYKVKAYAKINGEIVKINYYGGKMPIVYDVKKIFDFTMGQKISILAKTFDRLLSRGKLNIPISTGDAKRIRVLQHLFEYCKAYVDREFKTVIFNYYTDFILVKELANECVVFITPYGMIRKPIDVLKTYTDSKILDLLDTDNAITNELIWSIELSIMNDYHITRNLYIDDQVVCETFCNEYITRDLFYYTSYRAAAELAPDDRVSRSHELFIKDVNRLAASTTDNSVLEGLHDTLEEVSPTKLPGFINALYPSTTAFQGKHRITATKYAF